MLFLIVVPFGIHTLYKFHLGVPFLVGAFDAGAMLGFYGAVLGGFVTLLVLLITTNETRKIQQKNEEQIEIDRAERTKYDRKQVAYSVSEDVAGILANLALYKNGCINVKKCQMRMQEITEKLADTRKLISECKQKINNEEAKEALPLLESAEKGFMEALDIEKNNMGFYVTSKAPALEKATILNIKLYEIKEADELLDKIEFMIKYSENAKTMAEFNEESNNTMYIAAEFVKKYING